MAIYLCKMHPRNSTNVLSIMNTNRLMTSFMWHILPFCFISLFTGTKTHLSWREDECFFALLWMNFWNVVMKLKFQKHFSDASVCGKAFNVFIKITDFNFQSCFIFVSCFGLIRVPNFNNFSGKYDLKNRFRFKADSFYINIIHSLYMYCRWSYQERRVVITLTG